MAGFTRGLTLGAMAAADHWPLRDPLKPAQVKPTQVKPLSPAKAKRTRLSSSTITNRARPTVQA